MYGGSMESKVASEVREFISTAYLFGDEPRMPADEESLLESGVIDSTGVLELIEFLEERYHFQVSDTETVPGNLGSIQGIARYVVSKMGSDSAVGAA
jgi:acyl carrier protein